MVNPTPKEVGSEIYRLVEEKYLSELNDVNTFKKIIRDVENIKTVEKCTTEYWHESNELLIKAKIGACSVHVLIGSRGVKFKEINE